MTAPEPIPRPFRVLFCSEEKPRCPYGHRLRRIERAAPSILLYCEHADPVSKQICNTRCWVELFTYGGSAAVRGAGERNWIVMEVDARTAAYFIKTPMTLLERLHYLGHTMPGVDLDLFGGTE